MVNYFKTINGRIAKIDAYEVGCWVNVVAPTAEEEEALISQFSIPADYMKSSLDEEETSRIETEDGNTLIIIDVPVSDKLDDSMMYYTLPIGIIVTEMNVITVSLKDNAVIKELADGVLKNVHTNLKTHFILHILYRIANRFLQNHKQIDKISNYTEHQLRVSMKNKELIQLLDLEKSLVYFSTSLKSNEMTLEKILRGRYIKLYDEDQDLLEDVLVEMKQAIEMANIYLNILSGTMDAFASVISNNLNIVMKVLTSITIIMTIPTIVFGFYGMNVTSGLPFDGNWLYIMGLTIILTVSVTILLWKKKMFK